jgi:hypothetical protein
MKNSRFAKLAYSKIKLAIGGLDFHNMTDDRRQVTEINRQHSAEWEYPDGETTRDW